MFLDPGTLQDLEIVPTPMTRGTTLWSLVDRTRTRVGREVLRERLLAPPHAADEILALQRAHQVLAAEASAYRTTLDCADSDGARRLNRVVSGNTGMGELPRVRPKSRKAWRVWLEKQHASSTGVWLVYAKKHTRLPSLTYNDAVEEALCFGWIDSKVNPIDDAFYMQMFTPRKLKSAWSALNKTRVERLLAAGLMTPAGLVLVKAAKNSGTWDATKHVEELTVPPDLERALKANPDASRNWLSYSASRRKGVLYRLASAKRPETRARYLQEIIQNMGRNMSRAERMERAGFRPKPKPSRAAKH